jgi:hypothetical protein
MNGVRRKRHAGDAFHDEKDKRDGDNTAAGSDSKRSLEFQPQNESVSKLLAENERRGERLQRYTVIRTYEIKSREGKMVAVAVVRKEYRAPDVKRFERTSEKGSGLVRRLFFDQLMDRENESFFAKQREDSALTPVNHVFHFAEKKDVGPYHCG